MLPDSNRGLTSAPSYGNLANDEHKSHTRIGSHVQQQADAAGFSSPEEFVRETLRRMMAEEQRHQLAVVDGLRGEPRDELDDIRKLATSCRGAR